VFESRVLKRIFGPNKRDITEEWKKLHDDDDDDDADDDDVNTMRLFPNLTGFIK
jgi:hypothetical protein